MPVQKYAGAGNIAEKCEISEAFLVWLATVGKSNSSWGVNILASQ
jgi:hypothetical protein